MLCPVAQASGTWLNRLPNKGFSRQAYRLSAAVANTQDSELSLVTQQQPKDSG